MTGMFTGYKDTVLNLSNFDTRNVTNVFNLFSGDSSLTTIYVSNKWDISSITGNDTDGQDKAGGVFAGCIKLVGGNGTTYNSSYTTSEYAKAYKPSITNKGYFTLVTAPSYTHATPNVIKKIIEPTDDNIDLLKDLEYYSETEKSHKYIRRWKLNNGEWGYEYPKQFDKKIQTLLQYTFKR